MKLLVREVNWSKYLFLEVKQVLRRLTDELQSRTLKFLGRVVDWMLVQSTGCNLHGNS